MRFMSFLAALTVVFALSMSGWQARPILGAVTGPDSTFTAALGIVESDIDDGHYVEAAKKARALLAGTEEREGADALTVADVIDLLVEALRLGGYGPDRATRALAERSLSIRERALGPDHPEVARSLTVLGRVLFNGADYAGAVRALERSLQIRRAKLSPDDPLLGTSLTDLGVVEDTRGNSQRAEALLREGLAVRERSLGPDDPAVVKSLGFLAFLLTNQARYDESRKMIERAVAISQRTRPEHPETAWVYSGMGNFQNAVGAYPEAQAWFERALAIRERTLEPGHSDIAVSLNALGVVARRMERYAEAKDYFERALPILENRMGPEHPLTAQVLNNLAGVYWQMGATEEALPYTRRALAIREKILPPDHPELAQSYHSMGMLMEELGSPKESEEYYRRAIDAYERAYGPNHPLVAVSLWRLATLLHETGRTDEALRLSERALAIGESGPQRDHPNHASNLETHGSLLREAGRCTEAIPLYERALTILRRSYGPEHPEVGRLMSELAALEAVAGRRDVARATALEAEGIGREHMRLTARTLPERQALQAEQVRATSLNVLLTLASTSAQAPDDAPSDEVTQAWDALVRSRALILDEMARRRHALAHGADAATREAERAYMDASTALGRLLVQAAGSGPVDEEQGRLARARAARDESERRFMAVSREFDNERRRDRLGLADVAGALPEGSALVAYARYAHQDLDRCGRKREASRYVAFVLRATSGGVAERQLALRSAGPTPIAIPLGNAAPIDSLVERWREEAGRPPGRGASATGEAACRDAGLALAHAVWDPVAAHLDGPRRVFIVPDGALHLVNFAALPASDDPEHFLIEREPILHILSAERDLVPETQAPANVDDGHRGGLLALGDPDFDAVDSSGNGPPQPAPRGDAQHEARQGAQGDSRTGAMPALFAPQPYRGERAPCLELATHKWHRLAETAREVEETASLWRNEGPVRGAGASGVTFLTGARATEAAFKVEAQGRDVLHLATHAFFLSADCAMSKEDGSRPGASGPSSSGARGMGGYVEVGTDPSPDGTSAVINPLQLSGIVLAGANQPARSAGADGEDGILTAEEIASLDLSSTQWAVLSACDTGLGEVRAGEGVLGLRRAFQTAGVRTVIVSLWSVEDSSTRSWMRELYRARFLDGLDTMTATRQAGLAVLSERRRSGQSAHPFFWGGFLAAGDWR